MHLITRPQWRLPSVAMVVGVLFTAACADQITTPADLALPSRPALNISTDTLNTTVCKVGVPGEFSTFHNENGSTTGWSGYPLVANYYEIAAGSCTDVFRGGPTSDQLVISEVSSVVPDSIIVVQKPSYPNFCTEFPAKCAPVKYTGVEAVTVVANYVQGYTITFYNPVPKNPKIELEKVADVVMEEAGNPIGFTMTVRSTGDATATSITLTDPLPTGTGIVWSISPVVAGCSITANTLTCSFGDLAPGQVRTVHVQSPTTAESCKEYPNTASASSGNGGTAQASATVTVKCLPPPSSIQGCTPGYWKQSHHFDSWVGYTPTQNFNSVFGVNLFGSTVTLLKALQTGGGKQYRLGRHATAALLNSSNSNVLYGPTPAQVISRVQEAVATKNYDAASDYFEKLNERGCPLN